MDNGISLGELGKSIEMKKKKMHKRSYENTKYQGGMSFAL